MLRFTESFDHYTTTADFTTKWTAWVENGSATVRISAGNGRNSTASMRIVYIGGVQAYVSKTIDAQQTWILGFAYKQSASMGATPNQICAVIDTSTVQCDLRVKSDGTIQATRNGTVLGTTTFALSNSTSYYIEFKVKIHSSTGTIDVKVNDDNKLSLSGQNTQATGNATANRVSLGAFTSIGSTGGSADFDDVYFCDDQGSNNNDFLGDVRVEAIFPNGAGNSSQWTPSAGSNYQNVDETTPNDDTDYNSSANVNDLDTYTLTNVTPSAGTVKAINVFMRARKDDAGTRTLAAAIRTNSTDYTGANQNVGLTYSYYNEIWEQNPNTTANWTISEVNALEAGAKVIA